MIPSIELDSLDGDPVNDWFTPQIDAMQLARLRRRSNWPGLAYFGTWLILCLASGTAVVAAMGSYWIAAAIVAHGVLLSCSYAASHECSHGTAFRTRWLNEIVLWIASLAFMEEALYRRYAHAEHHTYTWFNSIDPQKPYGLPLTFGQYLKETVGIGFYVEAFRRLARHSLGRFTTEERRFLPERERPRVRADSLLMLLCYGGLLIWGVAGPSPWPFVLYFIPRFLGGCIVSLYINTQHMCMAEDLKDHRLTTRSIRCSAIERLLYWNMNFHIEHHLHPAVPFHALARLHCCIASELPVPTSSMWAANRDIVRAIRRQRLDPGYHLGTCRRAQSAPDAPGSSTATS
ncbi:MAG TPA: fatty acid desaturase [Steroidobacteraceae bacterium]